MRKYDALMEYLLSIQSSENEISISFERIETIIDAKLPDSAYKYRAWWSNPSSEKDHPYAQSWLKAGWMVDSVNQNEKFIQFRRINSITKNKSLNSDLQKQALPVDHNQNLEFSRTEKGLQLLLSLGFEFVGEWALENNSLKFHLSKCASERNILYAFIVQGIVNYVGKSTMSLNQRMNGYRNPGPSQTTNIRNHKLILDVLINKKRVEIFALVPKEEVFYKGFQINIAAGLEDNIINYIKPSWNDRK